MYLWTELPLPKIFTFKLEIFAKSFQSTFTLCYLFKCVDKSTNKMAFYFLNVNFTKNMLILIQDWMRLFSSLLQEVFFAIVGNWHLNV